MKTALFTGFPGFIASQLIRQTIQTAAYEQIFVLILPSEAQKALMEKEKIEAQFPHVEIHLLNGDITKQQLALNEQQKMLLQQVEVVWHLAAIYDLAVPKEIAYTVNVLGTQNVNEFVKQLPNVKRYMYFSTAYVAGNRTGILKENELIRPTAFKNYYEETKYEAECLVEQVKAVVPTTIIRPGIVRGHSETGETIKFDGPYFLCNMIDRLSFLPFHPYISNSTATLNVVPVDYIFGAATYLSELKEAAGKTVHLTDPNPHPILEVLRAMIIEMTGKAPKGLLPLSVAKFALKSTVMQKFLGVEYESLDYFTWDAHFDTAVAQQLLKNSSIYCPDFLETIPAMVAFYEAHKKNEQYQLKIGSK